MKTYVVYITEFADEILYIGSGITGREQHVIKGISHNADLNFEILNKNTTTKIVATSNMESDIRLLEQLLIHGYKPKYNKKSKNLSKIELDTKLKLLNRRIIENIPKLKSDLSEIEFTQLLNSISEFPSLLHDISLLKHQEYDLSFVNLLELNSIDFLENENPTRYHFLTIDVLKEYSSKAYAETIKNLMYKLKCLKGFSKKEYENILTSIIYDGIKFEYSPLSYLFNKGVIQ